MKLSIDISCPSPKEWIKAVMNDFDSFLIDHAECERKASAMCMSFVAKYPDRTEIIPELIETSIEEMEHFRDVYTIMEKRGLRMPHKIPKDMYIDQLMKRIHTDVERRFMDRLILGSIVECRGAERFRLVYENLEPGELKTFYHNLWASEAKHGHIFVKFALEYFDKELVYNRLEELNEIEAEIIQNLPIKSALH